MNKWCLLGAILSVQVHATTIELFVDQPVFVESHPGISIKVHDLSAPERLSSEYLPELPADPEKAKPMAMAFLASEKGKEFQSRLKDAHEHKTYLMRYGIQKIPAMVFDEGVAVIYGSTDIEQGLDIYREFLKKREAYHEE
jgi:integrating conjugative element protein (TIGR03757 family)